VRRGKRSRSAKTKELLDQQRSKEGGASVNPGGDVWQKSMKLTKKFWNLENIIEIDGIFNARGPPLPQDPGSTIRAPLVAYQLQKYFLTQPSPEWIFL
jgi:hypothetical protein